jgi:LPXTG-motif cell wall-anchored protein
MIGAIGTLILATFGVLAGAMPAQAAADDCKTVTVELPARPDSGVKGNDWATNTMKRELTVCAIATPAEGDWTYRANVGDIGTFTTAAGDSPDGTATLKGGVKGKVEGGFKAGFTAPKSWDGKATLTTPAASTSTSDWVKTAFPGAKFDSAGAVAAWAWTYRTACESWTNAEAGNSGDITERVCPTTSPTARPTAYRPTVAPPATTGPGGALPVTGTSLPLYVGGGIALLVVGAGAVWLTRRRVRIEA